MMLVSASIAPVDKRVEAETSITTAAALTAHGGYRQQVW
jgi:hypothetical protein